MRVERVDTLVEGGKYWLAWNEACTPLEDGVDIVARERCDAARGRGGDSGVRARDRGQRRGLTRPGIAGASSVQLYIMCIIGVAEVGLRGVAGRVVQAGGK
ncbi:hypothetical protein GCM10009799_24890 [Nocardiopsis rhodophaea]|uniref:Uncharacterized protein n=1 Tax=Nocardiopsis rhodophaea TaxID=280238 RepID=A0ABN2T2V5_9ACTN